MLSSPKAFQYNYATLDPSNSSHILLTFHEACLAPHASTCIAEIFDTGATWKLIDGKAGWNGSEGQVIFFLDDSHTWLWGSQTSGFWVSADSGASWQAVAGMATSHLQGSQVARSQGGAFFVNGADGVWKSPDGKFDTWKLVPDTGPISGRLVTSGTTLFAFLSSPEANGPHE